MKSSRFKFSLFIFKVTSRNIWKALMVLAVGFVFTILIAYYTNRNDAANNKKEFALVCAEIQTKISARLHSHAMLLRAGSAFFAASDTVTGLDWKKFNERIKISKNLPGSQGVGFSAVIPKSRLQSHIQHMRRAGFDEYTVKPAGDRDVYTSIIYIEPFTGRNLRAFGYDMFSEAVRRYAMEQSCDSDLAILSGKVILVQETEKDVQFGALMYVPVYRNGMPVNTVGQRRAALKGWVYSPYRINDLMQGILGRWDYNQMDRIHLQVYDNSLSANSLLYNSQHSDSLASSDSPARTVSLPIVFNGKTWILYFTQSNEQSIVNSKVVIILICGFAISLLLTALSLSLYNTRYHAQQIAAELTAELSKSEARFKMLLNSAAEGIYGLDMKGNCTFSNPACLHILDLNSQEQLLGKNMHRLIHHSHADGSRFDEQECQINPTRLNEKGAHVDSEVFWRADGRSFPVEYWSYPLLINGKIEGSVVTFFDITERKQVIEKIQEARNEAEHANRAKTEFLSRMSHELRTPLNSILGFAQLLAMNELNPGQKKGVNHILRSGKHLLELINEVLDISRIEAGNFVLAIEPVAVQPLIQEITDSFQPSLQNQQLSVFVQNPASIQLFVKSDRLRLKQVLLNLLSNSIKYNKPGGSITIKTELLPIESQGSVQVRISVTDTGIGIAPGDIPKLFKPFERIGAENTEIEGTGLGLAVVKKIIETMGGYIGIESVQGEGSTFWIELPQSESYPLKTGKKATGSLQQAGSLPEKTATVLYIGDNLSNVELVEQVLSLHRPEIQLITNTHGLQAVPLAIGYIPDLILLDLDLVDTDGVEVIMRLQGDTKTKGIPVVVVSSDVMPNQLTQLLNEGAINFLAKPLDIPALLNLLDEWLRKVKNEK